MGEELEEFNSSLPSSTPDYASLYFENYILDKDTNEKILMENPPPSNLKKIPVPDDFVKALLVSQTAITTDHQMEKFQENFLNAMGKNMTERKKQPYCKKMKVYQNISFTNN